MVAAFSSSQILWNKCSVSIFRILPNRLYAAIWRYEYDGSTYLSLLCTITVATIDGIFIQLRLWQHQRWRFWNKLPRPIIVILNEAISQTMHKSKHFELFFGKISNIANVVLFLSQKIIKIEEIWTHCIPHCIVLWQNWAVWLRYENGLHLSFCATCDRLARCGIASAKCYRFRSLFFCVSCGKLRGRHCKLGAGTHNLISNCSCGFTCLARCGIVSEKC